VEELFKQALSLIEDDAHWLDDAGQHCQDLASKLSEQERANWRLLTEFYRERAKSHRELAAKMRHWLDR
jgi:hypothetical protein